MTVNIWTSQKCCPLPLGTRKGRLIWVLSIVISEGHSYPRGITGGSVWYLCRGSKLVLEVRGVNWNGMEQKLVRTLAPGCARCLCPWPIRINNKYCALGVIKKHLFPAYSTEDANDIILWRNRVFEEMWYYIGCSFKKYVNIISVSQ